MTIKEFNQLFYKQKVKDKLKNCPNFPVYAIPKDKFSDKSSKELTKSIIAFFKFHGQYAKSYIVKGNKIKSKIEYYDVLGKKRTIGKDVYGYSSAKKGAADIDCEIYACLENEIHPISLEIEIKFKKDFQSDVQITYEKKMNDRGGMYFIVKSWDDAMKVWQYLNSKYKIKINYTSDLK